MEPLAGLAPAPEHLEAWAHSLVYRCHYTFMSGSPRSQYEKTDGSVCSLSLCLKVAALKHSITSQALIIPSSQY